MLACIFCEIIHRRVPASIVYENDQLIVFHDIHPKARVHLLVVTKKHIPSLLELSEEDQKLMSDTLRLLPQLAQAQGLSGFKTVINTGEAGGQEIPHLHLHLLGG